MTKKEIRKKRCLIMKFLWEQDPILVDVLDDQQEALDRARELNAEFILGKIAEDQTSGEFSFEIGGGRKEGYRVHHCSLADLFSSKIQSDRILGAMVAARLEGR